jgi:glucosyl-3-phosphoglycerate synthase
MSTVLIIPEKNEGQNPIFVAEQGLKAQGVEAVYILDGWSTDDTYERLKRALPELRGRFPNKRVELLRSRLRETGKGGAMVTGMERALADGFERILFMDGDITSVTPQWCELLLKGLQGAAMARGYFDRSPLDAQITRHITRPLMAIYFPEGRAIQQPLGGEVAITAELARHLLEGAGIAPPHNWGIDTFLTVNTVVGGFPVVEVYLTQKTHKRKSLTELRAMLAECFDELCKQIAFHGRLGGVPDAEMEATVLPEEEAPERIGEDVRTQRYVDPEEQMGRFFTYVHGLRRPEMRLGELGLSQDLRDLVLELFDEARFRERSAKLDIRSWVELVDQLARGYIKRDFSCVYHDVIFACWQLRALAFAVHEAQSFEAAEENTRRQAEYAYEYGARYRS